ncbi:T9SS type A sorting domain-containing protein [Pontibacter sp. H249]|uniref:T9SS type A sorting domain-containing protein n=1 Tax=Pontibacter sp. H249 TaxID=3133420 RepID=UPI0030C29702
MKGLFFTLAVSILCHCFALAQPNIVSGEYFFDQYVDIGKGQPLQVTPQQDLTLNATIDVSALEPGLHQLYLRFKNSEGSWSQSYTTAFFKPAQSIQADVMGFEYFFDEYVDFGKGTFMAAKEGDEMYTLSTNGLEPGLHVLNMRAKSSEGNWSFVNQSVFYVPEEDEVVNIVRLEYLFKDAAGNSTDTYAFSDFTPAPTIELTGNDFKANTSALADGQTYTLYVRAFADNGKSSMASTTTFTLKQVVGININAIEVTEVGCGESATGKIVVNASGGQGTLQYSLNGVNYVTSNTFEGLAAGEYTVYIKGDAAGYVETRQVDVSAKEMPATPKVESREEKTRLILFVTNPEGTIQWYKNGEPIEGATTQELEARGDGSYHVTVTSTDGCSVTSEAFSITGKEDLTISNATMVYPNPASKELFIQFPEKFSEKGAVKLSMFNMQGALVAQSDIYVGVNNTINFNLPPLGNGVYILLLQGEKYVVLKKIQKVE